MKKAFSLFILLIISIQCFGFQWNYTPPTGGYATYTVAASDSSAKTKARSDYICDGTADDVQIQAALNALPSTGGNVTLLDGTFNIHTTIEMPSDATLSGVGPATIVKLADTVNKSTIENSDFSGGNTDIVLRDMQFDGNVINNDNFPISTGMIHFEKVDGLIVDGLVFRNAAWTDLQLHYTSRAVITNNDIGTAVRDCIGVNLDCCDVIVSNNIIYGASNYNSGVEIQDGSKRIVVSGNVIYDCETGISVSSHIDAPCEAVTISGNIIRGNTQSVNFLGIVIDGATPAPDVTQQDIVITGNMITDTTGTAGNRYTVKANNTKGLVFTGNTVVSARYVFDFSVSTVDTIISGNHFIARVVDDERKFIQLSDTVNRMLISDNSIIDYEYQCFRFNSTLVPTDIRIKNNQIINVKRTATGQIFDFNMTGDVSTRCVIEGNYLDGSYYSNDAADAGANNSLPDGWTCDSIHATGIKINTANYTIHHFENGTIFTNEGDTGAQTLQLPKAIIGMKFPFMLLAAQQMILEPNGTETIALANGVQQAAGLYIVADAIGEGCTLECVKAGQWEHRDSVGTWTVQP